MIDSQNISKEELIRRLEENKKLYDSIQNFKKSIEFTDSCIKKLEKSTSESTAHSMLTYSSEREVVISKNKSNFELFAPTLSSGRLNTEEKLNKFIQECKDYDIKYAQFRIQVIHELKQLECELENKTAKRELSQRKKKVELENMRVEYKKALSEKEYELDKTAVVPPRYYGKIQSLIEILYYKDINTLGEAMEYFKNEQRKLREYQEKQRRREEEQRRREEEQRRRIEEEEERNKQLLRILQRFVETQEEEAQAMAERSKWEAKRFEEEKRMREQERDRARAIERKQRAEEFQKALNYSTAKREYDHASSLYESAVRQGRTIDAERLKVDKEKAALEMLRNK